MSRIRIPRHGRRSGFTLLETLVVLTVMAVAATLALPLVQAAPERLRVEAAARRLRGALQSARAAAVATKEDQILTIDTARATFASTAAPAPVDIGGVGIDLVVAEVERSSASTGGFRFFADGGSTGGEARLHLGRCRSVVSVDWLTGRIRLREGSDAP